jgi:uncharacterized protein
MPASASSASAETCAEGNDPAVMLGLRLSPDMFPLTRQVQIASDAAKGAGARLAGVPVPSYPDEEKSFDELQARVAKTIAFLQGLRKEQFEGAESRAISLKAGGRELSFLGAPYLETYAKPNFFFHLTAAYAILRHAGVELGKPDFLAGGA